ncbi:GAF domain-containing protein [Periweissella ghanensis]|uniref:Free methionine-R-sulfoxide reductase n=1 Tax=Periweissella ghanensis TaxID=467997 RepID=A0ABN8BPT1_9LACO|nr:GAF domain-containing protein [Periweissella ghanensis]MCM0601556.1 GAF domain-containing protein [Periweissella ghanensis]CAH0418633.1 Free methionine-R-sulfoxide reductase [Periweissella ghanensis]
MEDLTLLPAQLDALLTGENNTVANLSNASALLMQTLPDLNWAGFYLFDEAANDLVLGPFQGKVACMHIAPGKGVVGASFDKKQVLVVPNVHEFAGHIACDSASNSEIVAPIVVDDKIVAILDIDSPSLDRFSESDAAAITEFAAVVAKHF